MLPEVMQSGQITLPSYGSNWIGLLIKYRQQLVICPEFTEILVEILKMLLQISAILKYNHHLTLNNMFCNTVFKCLCVIFGVFCKCVCVVLALICAPGCSSQVEGYRFTWRLLRGNTLQRIAAEEMHCISRSKLSNKAQKLRAEWQITRRVGVAGNLDKQEKCRELRFFSRIHHEGMIRGWGHRRWRVGSRGQNKGHCNR